MCAAFFWFSLGCIPRTSLTSLWFCYSYNNYDLHLCSAVICKIKGSIIFQISEDSNLPARLSWLHGWLWSSHFNNSNVSLTDFLIWCMNVFNSLLRNIFVCMQRILIKFFFVIAGLNKILKEHGVTAQAIEVASLLSCLLSSSSVLSFPTFPPFSPRFP